MTAAVLTFLLRPVTTHSRGYIRDVKTRTHALTHVRIGWLDTHRGQRTTHIRTRAGRDIGGVLSYPFYHNNSPAMYKYTRIYICTKGCRLRRLKGTGSTWSSPSVYLVLPLHPLHPPELLLFSFHPPSSAPTRLLASRSPLLRLAGLHSNRLHL